MHDYPSKSRNAIAIMRTKGVIGHSVILSYHSTKLAVSLDKQLVNLNHFARIKVTSKKTPDAWSNKSQKHTDNYSFKRHQIS